MARIRITPEQVRQVGNQFKQASAQSDQMVNQLRNTINSLQGDWEGMTKERFYGEFQQWATSMTQFVQLLNQIGQQLEAIAERFRGLDQAG